MHVLARGLWLILLFEIDTSRPGRRRDDSPHEDADPRQSEDLLNAADDRTRQHADPTIR
jgi:hypothetical protein